ncbi:MAG TPA: DUF3592 domain-containing protein [Verrucomicrobiae bacterium]|nr:DUF3592 domain-containing protein [Verrucomicrobiae bacterium]
MSATSASRFWEGWSPPAELKRSAPRPVALTGGGIGMMVLAVAMAAGGIAGAIAFRATGRRATLELRTMEVQGRDAEGLVTRLTRTGGEDETYTAAYRFVVEGRDYQGRRRISRSHWRQLREGSPIAVRYLATDPSRNFPAADPPRPNSIWLSIGFAGGLLFLAGMFVWMVNGARHLLEDGRTAPGIITGNRRVSSEHGAHNVIKYEFRTAGGSTYKGRANRAKMPPGTIICVVYNPDNPRRNAPYPFQLVKVAN